MEERGLCQIAFGRRTLGGTEGGPEGEEESGRPEAGGAAECRCEEEEATYEGGITGG